jgi:hypothetical protein
MGKNIRYILRSNEDLQRHSLTALLGPAELRIIILFSSFKLGSLQPI